jgi:L-ascorbate metabolism protein UlaG (beta-lactamase superfamily)
LLQLTRWGHSAVSIENNGFKAVIDASGLNDPRALDDADAMLISHEHTDHYNPAKVVAAAVAKPGLAVYTNRSVAALLEQAGATSNAKVHVVGHGDSFDVGGVPIEVHGELHAPIYPDVTQVLNIGFLIDHRIFHPGDAYTDPGVPLDLLFGPLHGFYAKPSLLVDYIRHLRPSLVGPLHDALLNTTGEAAMDLFLTTPPPVAPGTGSPYFRPAIGQPFTV